jgi:amidohydrolase
MMDDGLMNRFKIDQVYGMHSSPGLDVGKFAIRPGAYMASGNRVNITIQGVGGHAAWPHNTIDPVQVGAQLVVALQSIVSRSVDPLDAAVVSMTMFHAGDAGNVIPHTASLSGTVRTLNPKVKELVAKRVKEVVDGVAAMTGAKIELDYRTGYPVLVNHAAQTDVAARVASEVAGAANVDANAVPMLGAEDFAFMLEEKPGAFIFIGNGDSAGLHHPAYNFNDEAIVYGTSYWIRLVETQLAA